MQFSMDTNGLSGFKTKRQKFGFGSMIFLMLFGAIFAGAGGLFYKSMQIDPAWSRVQGKVVDVSTSYDSEGSTLYTPVIEYTADGQSRRITGNSSSSNYPTIGGAREVAYNPSSPGQAKAVEGIGSQLFMLMFVAVGVGLFLLAPFLFIRSLKRSRHIDNLVATGHKLQGVLVDIQSEGSNNSGYKIVVAATDNAGMAQNYVSDSIAGIGALAMADFKNNPIPIDVYIDPMNPQHYYVDISDIPNLSPQRISELVQRAFSGQQQYQQPFTAAAPAEQVAPAISTSFVPPAAPVTITPTQTPPATPYDVNR